MGRTAFSVLAWVALATLLGACTGDAPAPVEVKPTIKTVSYLDEVKSILDSRCVVCHACYNAPCQLKLSSFDGLDRGASKQAVYSSSRLRA